MNHHHWWCCYVVPVLNQIKAVKELLTRSLGLDIPLRQPKQILKHFKNDKLNIKKLKHLGLWWFELCVCLIKTGFSHFPSWTVCICICVCSGFLAFPVEMFVFVCARVFLLSLLNCLYLYLHLLRLSYFPSWSDCICICKCSGFLTICICMCSGFLSLSVEVPKKKEACPSLAQTHPRWACWF